MKTKTDKIIEQLFMMARDKERVANARIVAAVVFKGKVVSYGYNQYRTAWMQRRFKKNSDSIYLHAEVDAIRNALKVVDADTVSKSVLYVARARSIGGKEQFGNAKPCAGCQSCIDWIGMKRVVFTTDNGTEQL